MGKRADKKVKQRRAEQKRSKLRARGYTQNNGVWPITKDDAVNTAMARTYESAAPADRRAIEARIAELAKTVGSDPARAVAALGLARKIAATPIGRGGMSGSAIGAGEFPNLRATFEVALATLHNTVPDACPHLTPDSIVAAVCVDEPGTVMCGDCQDAHVTEAHPPEWNHACLECGGVDMRGISPAMPVPIVGLPVRFDGGVRLFISPVVVTGPGSATRAGWPRAKGGIGVGRGEVRIPACPEAP